MSLMVLCIDETVDGGGSNDGDDEYDDDNNNGGGEVINDHTPLLQKTKSHLVWAL